MSFLPAMAGGIAPILGSLISNMISSPGFRGQEGGFDKLPTMSPSKRRFGIKSCKI